mmetsp:Transcript_31571/g.84344  ORF Transcript_31571/g.84344 Transcript_31571/m.84344 type:complete len:241 (-) Transcript_31571:78-800(-)
MAHVGIFQKRFLAESLQQFRPVSHGHHGIQPDLLLQLHRGDGDIFFRAFLFSHLAVFRGFFVLLRHLPQLIQTVAECHCDWCGLGDPRGLDHEVVEFGRGALCELLHLENQILPDAAANTAVLQGHDLCVLLLVSNCLCLLGLFSSFGLLCRHRCGAQNFLCIEVHRRHIVHNNRDLQAIFVLQQGFENSRLAGAEKPRENRDRKADILPFGLLVGGASSVHGHVHGTLSSNLRNCHGEN